MPGGVPPPPGPYYGQTSLRSNNGNSGCLKAFGITCLTLLVLGIIGAVVLFSTLRGVFQTAKQTIPARQDGQTIRQAIVAYHTKNGQYPPTLLSLVTDGESDGRDFHSDLDPNPSPAHISWQYTRPAPNAPGVTPILDLPYQVTVWGHTVPGHVTIDLDGGYSNANGRVSNSP
jgi:type II secretory pathway pseudopilin PulG